jgi:LAS superfamily LD-carboxypeptidase LdcB
MGLYEKVATVVKGSSPKRYRYKWQRKLLIRDWLFGNIVPIRKVPKEHRADYERMLFAAAKAAKSIRTPLEVSSSYRFRYQQEIVYQLYLAGKGPIAAKPGTSLHEKGRALDFPDNVGQPGLRDDKRARAALETAGFRFDVKSEGWHASFYG